MLQAIKEAGCQHMLRAKLGFADLRIGVSARAFLASEKQERAHHLQLELVSHAYRLPVQRDALRPKFIDLSPGADLRCEILRLIATCKYISPEDSYVILLEPSVINQKGILGLDMMERMKEYHA